MDHFNEKDGRLFAEEVAVAKIAERFGTPCYVYSRATMERHWRAFDSALDNYPHLICYAVKANSNLAVLDVLARLGSGFDIVSVGELERVLCAGGDAKKVVFSGVGKREDEIRRALQIGIRCFNVESPQELDRIQEIASTMDTVAPVSLRVNPDVDARTHPYISTGLRENKFGIDISLARESYRRAAAMTHIEVTGIDCHIGSQLTDLDPFMVALERVHRLAEALIADGIPIRHLDLGGGLGIRYRDEDPPLPQDYASALLAVVRDSGYEVLLEPGRAIMGNAGILVTRIEYLKHTETHEFAVVDAAMNDLMRPALYDAWQEIVPVERREDVASRVYDVVGPVCETGDFLGKRRTFSVVPGDLLAVRSAGAYGFSMSGNYNSRPRPAEVLVDGADVHLVRNRETLEDLMRGERTLPGVGRS
ncbi:MAG: diaminopimelate decarboxylase [Gammaproteobacteria bacterium]|jgi:diaminopimelate decarboxylase|nr:diaminopimelate decarboxylase [Gammaproteobacteria bacterium]